MSYKYGPFPRSLLITKIGVVFPSSSSNNHEDGEEDRVSPTHSAPIFYFSQKNIHCIKWHSYLILVLHTVLVHAGSKHTAESMRLWAMWGLGLVIFLLKFGLNKLY